MDKKYLKEVLDYGAVLQSFRDENYPRHQNAPAYTIYENEYQCFNLVQGYSGCLLHFEVINKKLNERESSEKLLELKNVEEFIEKIHMGIRECISRDPHHKENTND